MVTSDWFVCKTSCWSGSPKVVLIRIWIPSWWILIHPPHSLVNTYHYQSLWWLLGNRCCWQCESRLIEGMYAKNSLKWLDKTIDLNWYLCSSLKNYTPRFQPVVGLPPHTHHQQKITKSYLVLQKVIVTWESCNVLVPNRPRILLRMAGGLVRFVNLKAEGYHEGEG